MSVATKKSQARKSSARRPSSKPSTKSAPGKANAVSSKADLYETITAKIVAQLESGVRPWVKPWSSAAPVSRPLRFNGIPYTGINVLVLWLEAEQHGYASPYWLTYQQATELGGHVRKGEKGTIVVYANTFTKEVEAEDGTKSVAKIPFLKSYVVFNAQQCDGLPAKYSISLQEKPGRSVEVPANVVSFFAATGSVVRHGGSKAYYDPSADLIGMPVVADFVDGEAYASTLAHEHIHWTKQPTRLDRDFGRKSWGDDGYAMEELVAELGASFLCADLGVSGDVRPDHACYLASWLKVLKADKRAIFSAASHASKAVEYLHAFSKPQTTEGGE